MCKVVFNRTVNCGDKIFNNNQYCYICKRTLEFARRKFANHQIVFEIVTLNLAGLGHTLLNADQNKTMAFRLDISLTI